MTLQKMMVKEWLVQTLMSMYNKANIAVLTNHHMSEKFEVKVGIHQELVLSSICL